MTDGGTTSRARLWRERGSYFTWQPDEAGVPAVRVFHVEQGASDLPVLLLVHGFPTSSIDWFEVADSLSGRFRVCAVDFPGYGFSEKPPGWGYSLSRDASLLGHYLADILEADSATVVAHDRGDSVALIHAAACARGSCPVALEHLVLTNANVYLPLSNLTALQHLLLDADAAPKVLETLTAEMLALGMGAATFTPPRGADDPEVQALSETFAHEDGVSVLHETIQYLRERAADEESWLSALAGSRVPTTLIWGLNDTVSPPRVAGYVWNRYLMLGHGRNSLYFVPGANHYLQNDRPDAFVAALEHALGRSEPAPPGAIGSSPDSPLLIDCSRERLPAAAELLAVPPGLVEQMQTGAG